MKTSFLLFSLMTFCLNVYGQIKYKQGEFTNNNGEITKCLIRDKQWLDNPTKISYKLTEDGEVLIKSIREIKEFLIYDVTKFVRAKVDIDISKEGTDFLSSNKNPIFINELLLLEVLVEGKAILYKYAGKDIDRYFYSVNNSPIEQLIYKSYKTKDDYIAKNTSFKKQLFDNLKCSTITRNQIKKVDYYKRDLIKLFIDFNTCSNSDFTNYSKKEKKDFFSLNIRPRFRHTSLRTYNTFNGQLEEFLFPNLDTDYGSSLSFTAGIEAEFSLPFNHNKWAVIIEPTYQFFSSKVEDPTYGASVDYKSIELPIGLRYYFFLNDNAKIFINGSYIYDFARKFKFNYVNYSNYVINSTGSNMAFGVGFKFKDKYAIEIRKQTHRQLLNAFAHWRSDYAPMELIFSYKLF